MLLLNLKTPIFVRGGIVKGKLYSDGDIIFGEGLTRAYLLEETNARYPRIIMTKEVMQPLYDIKGKNADTTVGNLVFKDYDGFYTVDYFSKLLYFKPELRLKDKVVQYVTKILDTTTDSSLREKYNYFIDTLARISNS